MFAYSCILHVENVDQEYVAVEEEAAAEDQDGQQLQELEAIEPVEEQEFDLANPDQQPGKHRKHLTQFPIQGYVSVLLYLLVHLSY